MPEQPPPAKFAYNVGPPKSAQGKGLSVGKYILVVVTVGLIFKFAFLPVYRKRKTREAEEDALQIHQFAYLNNRTDSELQNNE